jgi:N-acetylmuramoyl-L-alanine amidase
VHGSRAKVWAVAAVALWSVSAGAGVAVTEDRQGEAGRAAGGWGGTEVRATAEPGRPAAGKPRGVPGSAARTAKRSGMGGKGKAGVGPPEPVNAVVGYEVEGDAALTQLKFWLGSPTDFHIRSLTNPFRVILDLPETQFRLKEGAGRASKGLVQAFRFGLIEAGKSRIVIDTAGPVRVSRAELLLSEAGEAFRLEIELAPTTAGELAAAELAEAALNLRPTFPETKPEPRIELPARPVIVVDAGHGGIDSGASGSRIAEKDLVLSVAQHIERALRQVRTYEVIMTRTKDVFVSLDERVALARQHNADLFVSVHADSLASRDAARVVRGATVYTLAEQASDELTRRVADKENAVDLLAGLPASTVADDQVRDILLDLMRRETQTFSGQFRETLLSELRSGVLLSRDPRRSGPFKVLRQPSSPAVLVELGYISNPEDERIMMKPEWQSKIASSVARAVGEHFRQRYAQRR